MKTKSSGLGLMDLQKGKHAIWIGPESLAIRLQPFHTTNKNGVVSYIHLLRVCYGSRSGTNA